LHWFLLKMGMRKTAAARTSGACMLVRVEGAGPVVPLARFCSATCWGLRFLDDARWCDVRVLALFMDSPFITGVGLARCR
jgi:hypothetical protein